MKRLDEITIADLMPDSISGDAQVSATARAIDPQLRLISEAVDRPLILATIDDLSAGVLEHLAVQYDVTAWDSAWSIETKRAALKTAIADKRKKGTRGAVERAIEIVAPLATLTEWWQDTSGDMPPHTFKIELLQEGSAVDPEIQANVIAQVDEAKPVRSHYDFQIGQLLRGDLYVSGVLRAISYARVRSAGTSIEQTTIGAGVFAALRGMNIRRLLASSHMGDMPEPVVPDTTLFGGDFLGNNISLDSVDGGGSVINRYNPGRALFPNTGWVDGTMIARYNPGRSLFELRGWEPGGCFWDVLGNFIIMDSTTGNVLSSVQIGNTDLPIEIDVLEPSEIINPTAPEELLIGVTTECPVGTTSLNSEYFWVYAFGQTYYGDTNWYDPSYYQNATPPYYQSDSTLTPVDGTKYSEVVLTNGVGGTYSPNSFALSLYNSKPELYLDNGFGSQSSVRNGMIVKYGRDISTQSLNLPSDMYTISGTTIWWNDNHPLMILLQGKPFEYV